MTADCLQARAARERALEQRDSCECDLLAPRGVASQRARAHVVGVGLFWFLRDTNVVFVEKRMQSGFFDILSATFHGNTRLDANSQIEGAFWFLHHHNYPFLSDIEARVNPEGRLLRPEKKRSRAVLRRARQRGRIPRHLNWA